MLRSLIAFLCSMVVAIQAEPMLRVESMKVQDEPPSVYDCLQAAVNGDDCRAAFDGQCVWCAEPVLGLCVTPAVADKIGMLPFFTCDDHTEEEEDGVEES